MGRKPKFSKAVKIKACKDYKNGKGSFKLIANKIGCSPTLLKHWYYSYLENGPSVFNYSNKNKGYTIDFKETIIELYLSGKLSYMEIYSKYHVSSKMLSNWIKKIESGILLKDYNLNRNIYTMKSRSTTFEKKLEIVKWVVSNSLNYKEAANKFSQKYSNVYLWTKKYLANGEDSLKPHAGRPKKSNINWKELSELDRLKLELEKEKALRKNAEFKLEVFKKKEEFRQARQFHL